MVKQKPASEKDPGHLNVRNKEPMLASDILGGCGFSLTVAWVLLVTYSRVLTLGIQEQIETFALLRFVGLISFLIGIYGLRRFYGTISRRKNENILLIICVVLGMMLPSAYLIIHNLSALTLFILVVAWIGHGLASAILFGCWGRFLSMLPSAQIMPTVIGAFFAAGCWFFIVTNLPEVYSPAVLLAMLLVSLACFSIYERDSVIPREADIFVKPDSRASNVSSILYGVVLGMLLYMIVLDLQNDNAHLMIAGSLAAAAFLLAAVLAISKRKFVDYGLTRRVLFPLSITCLLLLAIGASEFTYGLFALLLMAFYVLDIANWSTVAMQGSLYRTQPIYSFSSVRLPFTLGTALGWGVGLVAFGNLIPGFNISFEATIATIIVAFALSASVAPFGSEAEHKDDKLLVERREDGKDEFIGAWKQACIALARDHELTPREREVFLLLAKGRNAAVIEKELVVSPSTVKTHIYHVYQKLNVSSHQELLDMVEAKAAVGLEYKKANQQ